MKQNRDPGLQPAPHQGAAAYARAADSRSSVIAALEANERRVDALHGERMRLLALAALTAEQAAEIGAALRESASSEPVSSGSDTAPPTASLSATEARRRELERRSLVAEIATALHFSEATVCGLLDDAETLAASLPETFTALRSGTISLRHARTMAGNARSLPASAHGDFEAAALPEAAALTAAQFTQRVRVLRESTHPESIEVRHRAAREERGVWLDPERDGMAALHCLLPAVDALAIDDALDQIARALREADDGPTVCENTPAGGEDAPISGDEAPVGGDKAPVGGVEGPVGRAAAPAGGNATAIGADAAPADTHGGLLGGDEVPSRGDDAPVHGNGSPRFVGSERRTHAQRRADAFVDLLLGRESRATALARTVAPNLMVTVPVLTLLQHADEPGELHGYGPIPPSTARRLAARAPSFLRILTHPDTGETLSVGRERYRPPADLRLALIAEDETCRFPGCRRRAARCELDHTHDWATGGATSRDNLAHLCPKHHHLKHDTAWTVRPGPARTLTWTSPTGREHTTQPMGRPVFRPPTRPSSHPSTPPRRAGTPTFESPP
ncbi:DUF222 domain-containing protein [Herbiconiux sp. 11R-BC]|uniref:HNH endonuclease signature motif containing protein n=1 Tax=Herbiconiux sp. 11R-BC TaxID=3111637 RepID=UPI003C013447